MKKTGIYFQEKCKKSNKKLTMCGYCCDMCKGYSKNVKKKDEREKLYEYWNTYYGLEISVDDMLCDGCRCKTAGARIDEQCPIRVCVTEKRIDDCSACESYPCDKFMSRQGLNYEEAYKIKELSIDEYYEFLGAFDNRSRLDRKGSSIQTEKGG